MQRPARARSSAGCSSPKGLGASWAGDRGCRHLRHRSVASGVVTLGVLDALVVFLAVRGLTRIDTRLLRLARMPAAVWW